MFEPRRCSDPQTVSDPIFLDFIFKVSAAAESRHQGNVQNGAAPWMTLKQRHHPAAVPLQPSRKLEFEQHGTHGRG